MNEISLTINIPTIIFFSITLLAIGVCLFLIGYLFGRKGAVGVYNIQEQRPVSFFKQQNEAPKPIVMDERKYVVDIKTEGLEKKYESLGDVKESQENISGSINKLKNLKR
jgi:hypothetical protein